MLWFSTDGHIGIGIIGGQKKSGTQRKQRRIYLRVVFVSSELFREGHRFLNNLVQLV